MAWVITGFEGREQGTPHLFNRGHTPGGALQTLLDRQPPVSVSHEASGLLRPRLECRVVMEKA
jgi:hypothetical protein